jgi:hypothetical protein
MEGSMTSVKNQLLGTQNMLSQCQKQLAQTQHQLATVLAEQKDQHALAVSQIEKLASQPQCAPQSLNNSESDAGKLEKNSMKKVQLFNGIKR